MMPAGHLTLLYRGPLRSCNYACPYCPFAKVREDRVAAAEDAAALARFLAWVEEATIPLSVFFTPYGEALHHHRYRDAVIRLSGVVHHVAAQTNLAGSVGWLAEARTDRIGLWATYHPGQVSRERFLARCAGLDRLGVAYSVGMVGLRGHVAEIETMRACLPPAVHLWVNPYSDRGGAVPAGYYDPATLARLRVVDPLFEVGLIRFASRGRRCGAGEAAITVAGDGTVRRCHFLAAPLGNLYTDDLADLLRPRPCPRAVCDCHLGYVWLGELGAERVYGEGVLARVPLGPEWADPRVYLARARSLALRLPVETGRSPSGSADETG